MLRRRWDLHFFLEHLRFEDFDSERWEESDWVEALCFLFDSFRRGDFDLERSVEGDQLEERGLSVRGRLSRGDFDLERTGEQGHLSLEDLDPECTDEIDRGDDPWPAGDGLCGAEVRPVVAPTSWLGVGDDIPAGSTGSIRREGGGTAASDEASKRLDNPSRIGEGIDPEAGDN